MARKRRRSKRTSPPPARVDELLYPTLDLHGETADGARGRAESWLRAERAAGSTTVRLITGRGLHSPGLPVLPGEIEDLLSSLKGSIVRDWEKEPGGGVIRVRLRRTRAASQPAPAAPSPKKPRKKPLTDALRREAEESLMDLGITPTPELIEAEAERISRMGG